LLAHRVFLFNWYTLTLHIKNAAGILSVSNWELGVREATYYIFEIVNRWGSNAERNFIRIFNFSVLVESICLSGALLGPFLLVLLWCIPVLRKFCEAVSQCFKIYPISNQNTCYSNFWDLRLTLQIMLHI